MAISRNRSPAAVTSGSATSAPDPSPRRSCRSSRGSRPRRSRAADAAGSVLRCEAHHHWLARKATRCATSAQAHEMTPSRITGVRRRAACSRKPVVAARSGPPQVARRAIGSPLTGRPRRIASRTAAVLRIHVMSSMPVPRPTTFAGSTSASSPTRAAAGVVFPIPMSPAISRSAPASTSSSAIRAPSRRAATHSSRVMASSRSIDPLPRRIRCVVTSSGTGNPLAGQSTSTLTSTTRTVTPWLRARTVAAAPPVTKLATIWAVTSGGYALVPAVRATPWSPAKMASAGCSMGGGGHWPVTPASHTETSSSRPREPVGLVSVSWRASAATRASWSAGTIRSLQRVRSNSSMCVPSGCGGSRWSRSPRHRRRRPPLS